MAYRIEPIIYYGTRPQDNDVYTVDLVPTRCISRRYGQFIHQVMWSTLRITPNYLTDR